jgi:hypothetical protein
LFIFFAVPAPRPASGRFASQNKTIGERIMFDQKSDYAINKRSPYIVYRLADGSCLEVRPEDCPDFDRWKAISDQDYHTQELQDRRVTRDNLPLIEEICGASDGTLDEPPSDPRTSENAMAVLEGCLTEIQRRRYLMHFRDGKSTRQIARVERVSQRTIMDCLQESKRKIKLFSEKAEKALSNRPKNGDR